MKTLFLNVGRGTLGVSVASLALAVGTTKVAAQIPYPNIGTPNPISYTFTAPVTGDITAYFAGSTAAYEETLGMEDNGVVISSGGLDDHHSTVGQTFNLGDVTAGDTLTFFIDVISPDLGRIYSNPALNGSYDVNGSDGHNHVYSVPYTEGEDAALGSIPSGTYVAFEDLPFPNSDFNYFDETYVFADNGSSLGVTETGVPDATSTLTLLGLGFAGLGAIRRRLSA
jgi:hypothetical protein